MFSVISLSLFLFEKKKISTESIRVNNDDLSIIVILTILSNPLSDWIMASFSVYFVVVARK